jgi:hypothetical protein
VQRRGEQVQRDAEAEQQRRHLQQAGAQAGEHVEPLEERREAARGGEPERGGERRGEEPIAMNR